MASDAITAPAPGAESSTSSPDGAQGAEETTPASAGGSTSGGSAPAGGSTPSDCTQVPPPRPIIRGPRYTRTDPPLSDGGPLSTHEGEQDR